MENMGNSTNVTTEGSGDEISIGDLLPTIAQIFVTILLGWLTGTFNIIKPDGATGLNIFVGKFSLPSLVFVSMAELDFGTIHPGFLLGVFLSKLQIFICTIIIEVIISQNLSRAVMFGIFCTQTNDFAIGLPLLKAALGDHPYVTFLYIVAPISLVILNPIGFMILETQETKGNRSALSSLLVVMKGLLSNAIVMMTVLGLLTNLFFSGSLPGALKFILEKLGETFASLAPFTLGLGMVGKFEFLKGGNLSTLLIMMIIKCILAPISSHFMVSRVSEWMEADNTRLLLNFSFLYGAFPPALGVMSYASQYKVSPELVSAGIVLCTAVSAPIIFLSAKMLKIYFVSTEDFLGLCGSLSYNIAVCSVTGVISTLAIFLVSGRHTKAPHCFTTNLLLVSLISPVSTVLFHHGLISEDVKKLLQDWGILSVQIGATMLAICLVLILKNKELKKSMSLYFLLYPVLLSALVVLLTKLRTLIWSQEEVELDRTIAIIAVNSLTLILTAASLSFVFRHKNTAYGQQDIHNYHRQNAIMYHLPQVFRHSLLLLLMICSMISELSLPVWNLLNQEDGGASGSYKVIYFLHIIFSSGQGLLIFSMFLADYNLILAPVGLIMTNIKDKITDRIKLIFRKQSSNTVTDINESLQIST